LLKKIPTIAMEAVTLFLKLNGEKKADARASFNLLIVVRTLLGARLKKEFG
jgi:hypothetical protein